MTRRYGIWTAVSTKLQSTEDRHSLPIQERDGQAFADADGGTVVDVMRVPGHSRRIKDFNLLKERALKKGIDAFARLEQHWIDRDIDVLWVRSGDRFARTQSLHSRITEELIDAGILIYAQDDGGWVDKSNYRYWIAMSGAKAAGSVDNLVLMASRTKDRKAALGLYVNSAPAWSHKAVRNDVGRITAIVPDPAKRLIIEDAARLLLEGVSWMQMETELFERFGHGKNGKPFSSSTFHRLFHNPVFWGNNARRWYSQGTEHKRRVDLWVFDSSFPPPAETLIYYNTHEAALTGELAEQVKAELRRRRTAVRGSSRPHRTHKFAGLLLCGYCDHPLASAKNGSHHWSWRCETRYRERQVGQCRGQHVRDEYVQEWLDNRLRLMVARRTPDVFEDMGMVNAQGPDAATLKAHIADVNAKARRLIAKQASADASLAALYDEQIQQCADELKALQTRLQQLDRQSSDAARQQRAVALATLKTEQDIDMLWTLPEVEINRFLHRLLSGRRLVFFEREVRRVIEE